MVLVAKEDNTYHKILVREYIKEKEAKNPLILHPERGNPYSVIEYGTISGENFTIVHAVGKNDLLNVLRADFNFWDMVLYTDNFDLVKTQFEEKGIEVDELEDVITYEDRQEFFKERLEGISFAKDVRDILVRLLVQTPDYYESVIYYIEDLQRKVELEDLQYILGDIDLYHFDELLLNIFYGLKVRKTPNMIDYFVNVREYNPVWIYNKLREMVQDIGYLYEMYNQGVFSRPVSEREFNERIKASGRTPREEWIGFYIQKQVLIHKEAVGRVGYAKRANIVYNNKVRDIGDLYAITLELEWRTKQEGGVKWRAGSRF